LALTGQSFGRSPAPAVKFSLLADLITVLDRFGLDRVAIVGCSQGGGSALGLALEHPARVSALVLLCPGVPGYPWPEQPDDELDAVYEHALAAGDVEVLAGLLQRAWAAAGPAPAVMEQFRSAARAEISNRDLRQQEPPVFGRLGEISVSASLLVGDADYPPLIEADRQAAARIPGCELTVAPGWTTCRRCVNRISCCVSSRARCPEPAGKKRVRSFTSTSVVLAGRCTRL
jgi:3-oxoadipate enol-lactonase